jgi:hypothetical protein
MLNKKLKGSLRVVACTKVRSEKKEITKKVKQGLNKILYNRCINRKGVIEFIKQTCRIFE